MYKNAKDLILHADTQPALELQGSLGLSWGGGGYVGMLAGK